MPRRAPAEVARGDDSYRPLTPRRRVLIALLAVATALTLILMMLERVGAPPLPRPPPRPDAARCAAGQTTDCVGGKAEVIVMPAQPPASAPEGVARER